jgi:ubiquinone biosynthesis protein COQ9
MSDALAARHALKDRVLEAALLHAAFDGWSRRTLHNAAHDAGIDAATVRRLFPRGGDSLLAWLDDWADRRMLASVEGVGLERMPVRRRIALLVRARLEPLSAHREAVRRAAAARALPGNLAGTGQSVWRTVDLMWQAAGLGGAPAEGFAYYSRRATLAGVLTSTLLFWLGDQSEDFTATWAFLDRRIEDVMRVGRARSTVEGWASRLMGRRASTARG